jgi:hypothetical protein
VMRAVLFPLLLIGATGGAACADPSAERMVDIPDGTSIVIERYFESDEHSELRGWRERVIVNGSLFSLEVDCWDAGGFAERGGRLSYHCGQEWVAERLLHAVIVRDENGGQLHYIEHCRDPVWVDDEAIVCKSEHVTFEGEIALEYRQFPLPQEFVAQGPTERLWLVVGASDRSPGGSARQSKALLKHFPDGFVVQTSDCGEPRSRYAWSPRPRPRPKLPRRRSFSFEPWSRTPTSSHATPAPGRSWPCV